NRIFKFSDRQLEQTYRVVEEPGISSASFQVDGRPDVLERIDDTEERADCRNLGSFEIYSSDLLTEARGVVELGAVVEVYSLLDRRDHVSMKERRRIGGLDQHGRVECAVADPENTWWWSACPEASVSRILLGRDDQIGWLRRELLDVGVEISVLVDEEKIACTSAEVAEKAL